MIGQPTDRFLIVDNDEVGAAAVVAGLEEAGHKVEVTSTT